MATQIEQIFQECLDYVKSMDTRLSHVETVHTAERLAQVTVLQKINLLTEKAKQEGGQV